MEEALREAGDLGDELHASEHTVRTLLEAIEELPIGVLVQGRDGAELAHNRHCASPSTDVATNVMIRRGVTELAAEVARTGVPAQKEVVVHGPPARAFELTARPLDAGGVVTCVEDVTERHRLAEMRRDFTVNASHELRTPIGAIGLLAETLESEHDLPTVHRLASRVVAEADRARSLLEGILELSRLEAGGEVRRETAEVAPLVDEAVSRLATIAERHQVTVKVDVEHTPGVEKPVAVEGDPPQLVSAIANLLDNAIKYSPEGASVVVSVRRASPWVEVEVSDSGVGIPARDLDRVFERFYRVDRGRGRQTGGTGLGLAIVRHVAENHGGVVLVDSREGEGSRFVLRLPEAL
jgi:two-component system, OmpR family, sensor histidine kinase SenX3